MYFSKPFCDLQVAPKQLGLHHASHNTPLTRQQPSGASSPSCAHRPRCPQATFCLHASQPSHDTHAANIRRVPAFPSSPKVTLKRSLSAGPRTLLRSSCRTEAHASPPASHSKNHRLGRTEGGRPQVSEVLLQQPEADHILPVHLDAAAQVVEVGLHVAAPIGPATHPHLKSCASSCVRTPRRDLGRRCAPPPRRGPSSRSSRSSCESRIPANVPRSDTSNMSCNVQHIIQYYYMYIA